MRSSHLSQLVLYTALSMAPPRSRSRPSYFMSPAQKAKLDAEHEAREKFTKERKAKKKARQAASKRNRR